jgi:N-methylhydantoinase B
MPAGSSFVLDLPGGGGYHDPLQRSAEALSEDIAEGLVTEDVALEQHGKTNGA